MARRKYIKDYRLVETVDERGRIRTDYEYIGAAYRYACGPEAAKRERRLVLAACAVGWLAFLGGLLPRSAGSHVFYISLPYVFTALPLGLVTALLLDAAGRGKTFQRRHADRMTNVYPPACLFWALLPLISLLGTLVCLLRKSPDLTGGDAVFSLCAAVLCAAGFLAFSRRGRFAPEKL